MFSPHRLECLSENEALEELLAGDRLPEYLSVVRGVLGSLCRGPRSKVDLRSGRPLVVDSLAHGLHPFRVLIASGFDLIIVYSIILGSDIATSFLYPRSTLNLQLPDRMGTGPVPF